MAKAYKKIAGVWQPIKKIWKNIGGTWIQMTYGHKKVSGIWQKSFANYTLVTNNVDAYVASDAGDLVEHDVKGELVRNGAGILQASDGTRLGRYMDVWFATDDYANTATQFIHNCYADSANRRCYDNKAWVIYTYSTGTQKDGNGCGCQDYKQRTIYYNRYHWA